MTSDETFDPSAVLSGGVAVIVATADADGRPAITRGWGVRYDADTRTVTLSLTAPSGSRSLANLKSNGAISVTASQPLDYTTVQLKGTVEYVDAPSEDDRVEALAHLDRFVAEVAQLGIANGADRLYLGDLRTASFIVEEMYEQTPGQAAGQRLQ